MKHLKLLLSVSALATLIACAVVPETGRRQVMLVSPNEEAQAGLTAFAQLKQQEKISSNPGYNDRIQRIGRRISASVGRDLPNAQWEFVVFESDQVNAFALPGGKVGVYTGLIKLAESDDELACVIGHEIAHVSSRHSGERLSQQMLAAGVGSLAAIAADEHKYRDVILGVYGLGATGVILGYSRSHETEADTIGLRFAAGAGYDPRASVTFWQKMAAKNKGKEPWKWVSTHPPSEERIANLQRLAPEYMPLYEQSKGRFQ